MDKYTEAFPEEPKLSRDEELAKMQKKAMDEYAIVNRFSAAQRDKLTPQEMLNRTKPGFVRGLFSRDSKEWKDFEYMYKAFHDEKNVYYKNTTELRAEAQKYLDAKGIALLEDIENLPERSQQKALLCYTICTKYEDLDPLDTSPKIQREQAIENVDVLNDGPSSQNENKNDLENLMDLSVDDLDNSLDK